MPHCRVAVSVVIAFALTAVVAPPARAADAADARYETRRASRDGIGKFYFGREIAHVMGHQGADWLERPEREEEERTDLLLDVLELQAGQSVADIGAGSGYFSWRMAKRVAPAGAVYAVEIQQEFLDLLMRNMRQRGVAGHVKPVLGTTEDPRLPEAVLDLILLVDVYHEFDHPYEMTRGMIRGLRPGGRLVFVEYRGEDPTVPIKPLHKMTVAQVRKEMAVHAELKLDRVIGTLPRQHVIVFRKL